MSWEPDKRGYAHPEALVSTEWLARHLNAPDLRIVDATWHMPGSGRDARTGEIGAIEVTKIENKGKMNRRVNLALVGAAQ